MQSVHKFRSYLAKELRVPQEKIRFTVKDVGGGFGTKGAQSYPETALAALFARKTGLTIKWTSTRTEDLLESSPDRDQYCDIELACDKDRKIVALRANIESDIGVMGTFNISLPHTIMLLPGAYEIPSVKIKGTCYVTNKVPIAPVRGAGRPEACFFIESAIDVMAQKLAIDPLDFRRRNVVQPYNFPHDNGAGVTYDSGNYPLLLDTLAKAASYKEGPRKFARSVNPALEYKSSKELSGRGVCLVIEDTGAQLFENANLLATKNGKVLIGTGSSPHGQGLDTTLAQLCSSELGIPIEKFSLAWGDTDLIPQGLGTFASRSISVGGSAVLQACRDLKSIMVTRAADVLARQPAALTYKNGWIIDSLNGALLLSFEELLAKIGDISLSAKFTLSALPVASGAQYCELRIDAETDKITIDRILVVDDCGRVINAAIVEGQIQGGLVHGIGGALYEEILYDDNGQPSASNLLDYTIPTAEIAPSLEIIHIETLSPVTLSGAKGVGESGTIGAYPVIFNALNDALSRSGKNLHFAPATPEQVLRALGSTK
ncbi:MAG: xanthine dehydrogenase family protein molybdopterin-binding subunit [Nitrososphaerales archaeon]